MNERSGLAVGQGRKLLVIVPYDPEWPQRFAEIRGMLQRTVPGTYHSVEHVGSTSVPGMAAKPIIDIDIVMREGVFELIKRGLESLGYVDEGDLGIPGRVAFDLQDAGLRAALAPHHLYVVPPDSPALRDHRDFRDYLLAHPEWRERMSAHKRELASLFADDREGYQKAKSPMVVEVLALARSEQTSPPGPLSPSASSGQALRGEGENAGAGNRAAPE